MSGEGYSPLLENADAFQPGAARPRRTWRQALNDGGEALVKWPLATRNRRWISSSVAIAALVLAAAWAFLVLRPVPKPDYETGSIERVFGYTLLTSEFNKLPVQERLELLGQLVRRIEQMDQGESLLLASFAAGISGGAREQLMENASRLMIDVADIHATDYGNVAPDQRAAFLEQAFMELTSIEDTLSGRPSSRTPEERLERAKEQAQRDMQQMRENPMSFRQQARVFRFMDDDMGRFASPQQRGRITVLMRDMTRYLRGQDVNTGRPARRGG